MEFEFFGIGEEVEDAGKIVGIKIINIFSYLYWVVELWQIIFGYHLVESA